LARELEEERYARELLARKFGVNLRKIPESPTEPRPDFEVMDGYARVAVAELKCLPYLERSAANGWLPDADSPFLVRDDNATKRVGNFIYQAWKQLRHYDEPKILIFVNDESGIDVHDLEEAYQGVMQYGTEETGFLYNTAAAPIAQGRIKEIKGLIDLYIWVDRRYGEGTPVQVFPAAGAPFTEVRTAGPVFRCTTDAGHALAQRLFGCPDLGPRPDA
jgi:hypothetical protein